MKKTEWVSVFSNEVLDVLQDAPDDKLVAVNPELPVAVRLFPLTSNQLVPDPG